MPTESYPLSPIQQGMLFHWLLDRHSGNDIEQMVADLREPIDPERLARAWQHAVAAFATLRTAFAWEDLPAPVQHIQPLAEVPFSFEDLRSLPAERREERVQAYLRQDRREGFDLTIAPAMRVMLYQLGDAEFRMIWSFHHILIDGRSFETVLTEVFETYQGQPRDAVPDRPYRPYIDWVTAQDESRPRAFWRDYLRGFTATTPLLADRPAAGDGEQFGQRHTALSVDTTAGLRALAAREQLSLNSIVMSVWALLLARYSGEPEVVFGATKTTRRGTIPDADDIVGLFLATIPVRVAVDPDLTLRDWLRQVRETWVSLRGHEHLPLVEIRQQTELPAGAPLFDSFVMFENDQIGTRLSAKGGPWSRRQFTLLEQPGLPLGLMAYGDDALALKIDYDARRFDARTIDRTLGHLTTMLRALAAGLDEPVWRLPMLSDAERHTLVDEWNRTAMAYPRDRSLAALIEEQVRNGPDRPAISFDDQQVTYRELNERANRLAHHLIRRGVGPDALVGVCLERTPDLMVALVAVVKAGGAYVPLDPGFPKDRLSYMAEDAALTVLITAKPLDDHFASLAAPVVLMDRGWDDESAENPVVAVGPEHLAYVIYTSGSTGKPKGVEVTRGGFLNLVWSMMKTPGMHANDSVVALTTASFDIAGVELVMPFAVGARVILAARETALNPEALRALIERTAPTIVQATPVTFRMLFESGWRGDGRVKTICGGEAIPVDLGEALATACSEAWNGYGPTETTVYSAFHCIHRGDKVIYIGRPPANTTIYILDPHQCLVPQGATGELYIGGDGVARGYRNRPELTAEKFVADPFRPGQVIYRTGDLARYAADGTIECLGRTDHQVKIRGFRIELGEIESLLKQRPDVRQAVVIAREDQPGDKRLVAYLVAENATLEPAALRSYLKTSLPDYMVPAAFVQLDVLPSTPNGKIDRRALPAPSADASGPARVVKEPRTDVERQLTAIWREVFQTNALGLDDNFWDLGGHSMLAVKLMGRISVVFGKRLPLNALYTAPTVEQLARLIEAHENSDGRHTLVAIQHAGHRPPVYWIPGGAALGLFSHTHIVERLGPEQPVYGLGSAFPKTVKDIERVEERAAKYLQLVRQVQPHGPYHFVGFCAGGMIAFEMAQQLRREGETTALVGMINCHVPRHIEGRLAAFRFKAQRLRHQLRRNRAEGKSLLAYVREKIAARLENRSEQLKVNEGVERAKREGFVDTGDWNDRVVLDATVEVVSQYQPAWYDGPVSHFISEDDSLSGVAPELDPRFAWSRYAADVQVYPLKGGHEEVVKAPYVFELADAIDAALHQALAREKTHA